MANELQPDAALDPALDAEGTPTGAAEPTGSDSLLFEMESRCEALRTELAALELRLRELRIAADLCPRCGGAGQVKVRGGLYGEVHHRPCTCKAA